jgi:hypothetical protein
MGLSGDSSVDGRSSLRKWKEGKGAPSLVLLLLPSDFIDPWIESCLEEREELKTSVGRCSPWLLPAGNKA